MIEKFNSLTETSVPFTETVESEREEMVYPIAIAIIETSNAIFKSEES